VLLDHYVQRLVGALRDQVKVVQLQQDGWCELSQPRAKIKMSRWAGGAAWGQGCLGRGLPGWAACGEGAWAAWVGALGLSGVRAPELPGARAPGPAGRLPYWAWACLWRLPGSAASAGCGCRCSRCTAPHPFAPPHRHPQVGAHCHPRPQGARRHHPHGQQVVRAAALQEHRRGADQQRGPAAARPPGQDPLGRAAARAAPAGGQCGAPRALNRHRAAQPPAGAVHRCHARGAGGAAAGAGRAARAAALPGRHAGAQAQAAAPCSSSRSCCCCWPRRGPAGRLCAQGGRGGWWWWW
jgi:hypothetical protein